MVNRAALILRYKEPAVRWINDADPNPRGTPLILEQVNEERTVYLITDEAGQDPRSFERWLKRNYQELFERELYDWYTDPALWPKQPSYEVFRQWFDVELHTVLIDLGTGDLYDDEA